MKNIDFDKILSEISWRLYDGIIDFSKKESIDILRNVLIEMEYDSKFIDEYIYNLKNNISEDSSITENK